MSRYSGSKWNGIMKESGQRAAAGSRSVEEKLPRIFVRRDGSRRVESLEPFHARRAKYVAAFLFRIPCPSRRHDAPIFKSSRRKSTSQSFILFCILKCIFLFFLFSFQFYSIKFKRINFKKTECFICMYFANRIASKATVTQQMINDVAMFWNDSKRVRN